MFFKVLIFVNISLVLSYNSSYGESKLYSSIKKSLLEVNIGLNSKSQLQPFKFAVDLNTDKSFLFGSKCKNQKSCSVESHNNYFDLKGKPQDDAFDDGDYNSVSKFAGEEHNVFVNVSANTVKIKLDIIQIANFSLHNNFGIVDKGNPEAPFNLDGRLGLGFSEEPFNFVKKLFAYMEQDKVIVIKNFLQKARLLKNVSNLKKMTFIIIQKNSNSLNITFGKLDNSCKGVNYIPILNKLGKNVWQIKADVIIGNSVYKQQDMAFLFYGNSLVPQNIFENHFNKNGYNDDIVIKFDNNTVFNRTTDFNNLETKQNFKPNTLRSHEFNFGLGFEFLQGKCLILREHFEKYEIGIGDDYDGKILQEL